MGIVAVCPNGHRIKVKDELAGRKGICPTCSARFRIPRQDAAPAAAARDDALERTPTARVVALDPRIAASLPAAVALDDAETVDTARPVEELADVMPGFAPEDDPAVVAAQPGDESSPIHAAVDEQPGLVWCVAVRGGAPSAPLDAVAMRTWLASGAASADHVVWRQDWPEWRPIQEVFPAALPPGPRGWP